VIFDFEDYRPDVPRVPSVFSRREGILLSIIVHAVGVLTIIWVPSIFFTRVISQAMAPQETIRYVQMDPRIDRSAPPKRLAEHSDKDRRSATRDRSPNPENTAPYAKGSTPEKVEGGKTEPPANGDTGQNQNSKSSVDLPSKVVPDAPVIGSAPAKNLGESLRNLQRYLQDQNFNNPKGGLSDQDPDVQFDAKGVEFGPWLRRFVAQVKSNWNIPQAAMARSGRVVIQFYVLKNGAILDLQVIAPSSTEAFTTAAFNALRLSNPTLPLPPEYPADRAFFTVTFHYNEGRP
jgi:TonB family protein